MWALLMHVMRCNEDQTVVKFFSLAQEQMEERENCVDFNLTGFRSELRYERGI